MVTSSRRLVALLTVSAALAVNGFVLGPLWLVVPGDFSDTVATPAYVISQQVSWALLTALIVLIPSVAGAGRRALPAWLIAVVQVALAAQAATHFVQGFVLPWLTQVAPQAVDSTDGGMLQLTMTLVWIGFVVVMVTFAVAVWWAGLGRVAAVLIALGALITPVLGPIGAGIVATGLVLVASKALRARARHGAAALVGAPA